MRSGKSMVFWLLPAYPGACRYPSAFFPQVTLLAGCMGIYECGEAAGIIPVR